MDQLCTIGFPGMGKYEHRKKEGRIALLPQQISNHISHPEQLYFERGYARHLGIDDAEYEATGAIMVDSQTAYSQDVLCKPKINPTDLIAAQYRQLLFGWAHAEHADSTAREKLIAQEVSLIEWSHMKNGNGEAVFYRNGFITGEIGVEDALAKCNRSPLGKLIAVIGRGRVGSGAVQQLKSMGAKPGSIDIYHSENIGALQKRIDWYDIIVHCAAASHTILDEYDLIKPKPGALFIHLGSDSVDADLYTHNHDEPLSRLALKNTRTARNLLYYCVNNVPAARSKRSSEYISEDVAPYIEMLIHGKMDGVLRDARFMQRGKVHSQFYTTS